MSELLKEDFDNIFHEISQLTYTILLEFSKFFMSNFSLDKEQFFDEFKYDFDSLHVVTLYKVLKFSSQDFSSESEKERNDILNEIFPSSKGKHQQNQRIDTSNTNYYIQCDRENFRKSISRLNDKYTQRNNSNLDYFNMPDHFEAKMWAEDSIYDLLLRDVPEIRRFLLEDAFIMKNSETFFDSLGLFYKKIESYCGIQKFDLYHHFESDCHIEMFYKSLQKIKLKKRKCKLDAGDVDALIFKLAQLHKVPLILNLYKKEELEELFNVFTSYPQMTNSIVFDTQNLIDLFIVSPDDAIKKWNVLSYIHTFALVSSYPCLTRMLEGKYQKLYKKSPQDILKLIIQSEACTTFFDNYLNEHPHIFKNKKPSNDITMTHFKTLYNIKKEPVRPKN